MVLRPFTVTLGNYCTCEWKIAQGPKPSYFDLWALTNHPLQVNFNLRAIASRLRNWPWADQQYSQTDSRAQTHRTENLSGMQTLEYSGPRCRKNVLVSKLHNSNKTDKNIFCLCNSQRFAQFQGISKTKTYSNFVGMTVDPHVLEWIHSQWKVFGHSYVQECHESTTTEFNSNLKQTPCFVDRPTKHVTFFGQPHAGSVAGYGNIQRLPRVNRAREGTTALGTRRKRTGANIAKNYLLVFELGQTGLLIGGSRHNKTTSPSATPFPGETSVSLGWGNSLSFRKCKQRPEESFFCPTKEWIQKQTWKCQTLFFNIPKNCICDGPGICCDEPSIFQNVINACFNFPLHSGFFVFCFVFVC